MRRYAESTALSRIAQSENVLRHSLTPQHPSYDIIKIFDTPQEALTPLALIHHFDREETLPKKQRTHAEVAKIPTGGQACVKKLETKCAPCVLKKTNRSIEAPMCARI